MAPRVEMKNQTSEAILEFRNVSFHYPSRPDVPVFNELTCRFGRRTTAVVGASGSGKSIARLS